MEVLCITIPPYHGNTVEPPNNYTHVQVPLYILYSLAAYMQFLLLLAILYTSIKIIS